MTIKELRTKSGMTQQAFGDYFGIPLRSIQNWEGGQRQCPEYLLNLMKYKLEKEKEKIPQKPVERFPFNFCPRCDRGVHKGMNYCSECGLALDWSEEETK